LQKDLYALLLAMPNGMKNPVPAQQSVNANRSNTEVVFRTHEKPVSQPEESCLGIEGQTGIRTLRVVVGAESVHSARCGGEAAAGDEPGGYPGTDESLSVHLSMLLEKTPGSLRRHTLSARSQRGESWSCRRRTISGDCTLDDELQELHFPTSSQLG
jgi:hypothetical protein